MSKNEPSTGYRPRYKRTAIHVPYSMYLHISTIAKSLGLGRSTLVRMILIEGATAIKLGSFAIDPEEMRMLDEIFPDTGQRYRIDVNLPLGVWFFLDTVASAYNMSFSQLCNIILKKRLYAIKVQGIRIDIDLINRAVMLFREDEEAALKYLEMVKRREGETR